MNDQITIELINIFLDNMKKAIKEKNVKYYFEDNEKNYDTFDNVRYELGMDEESYLEEIKEYLLKLTYKEWNNGPEADDNKKRGHDEVWKFRMNFHGINLYVKFVIPDSTKPNMICWSFHEEEHPMYCRYGSNR